MSYHHTPPSQLNDPSMHSGPQLLVDGYISQCFGSKSAEGHFSCVLKTRPFRASPCVVRGHVYFVVTAVPPYIFYLFPNQPSWVIDRAVVGYGTVIPQTLWVPHTATDQRQHVVEAELQMPIFFEGVNGRLGLSLEAASTGRCNDLLNAQGHAPLGLKSTTHIRIGWPGYVEFKRQVQTRDETSQRNPITIFRFAYHIGRSVDAFLKTCQPDPGAHHPRWLIGEGAISPRDIVIIGAIHVSSGSWMPILQMNRYIF
ncbi:hypothetical protein F5148DRAFT_318855 [Russula earlei]|uniref:Uncharacterized protein n=1 Tax=Russula earlei TaxID=71964 RepID=A0ACC0U2R0_9AGAM|nr:hypothetical protein F5148DRAFT_318855 [Russula earlei]